jgi:hypothetical protein
LRERERDSEREREREREREKWREDFGVRGRWKKGVVYKGDYGRWKRELGLVF